MARATRAPARTPRRPSAAAFDALTVEGALIAQAQLTRIAALEADQQTPADYAVPRGLVLRDEIPRFYRMDRRCSRILPPRRAPRMPQRLTLPGRCCGTCSASRTSRRTRA